MLSKEVPFGHSGKAQELIEGACSSSDTITEASHEGGRPAILPDAVRKAETNKGGLREALGNDP